MRKWTYKYGDNIIEVKNEKVIGLYANGKLLDSIKGVHFSANLKGKLDTGEEVQASLGGFFTIECKLAVNYVYLAPVEVI